MSPVWHLLPRLEEAPERLQAWHPLVWQACQRKGLPTLDALEGWLDPAHYQPASPLELPDLARATERIQRAVQRGESAAVWGDFDVDGQTSTALLVSALRQLGLRVSSYIPNRMTEGHGVHVATLIPLIEQGIRLLITCDTGVDAHEAVEVARQHGVEVIITDHHKLPDALPDALAVVNPRRLPLDHPLRDLPGVGVAYKLAEALLPDASVYLDLVALGIVADVALLRGDTRYLLQQGLKVLHVTQRKGLLAMMDYAKISQETLDETTIAFQLAPRLNALGRLADANSSTEMLTTDDLATARRLANQLEGLNLERRRLSDEVWESVQVLLEQNTGWLRHAALVLDHPKWHTGVLGIVANRCVEHYHKPTVLLSSGADGIARGSARSIEGADITDAIAMTESLLLGYGGHTVAAGVSLQVEKIDAFRRALSEQVRHQLGKTPLDTILEVEATLAISELSPTFFEQLFRLAPFGAGNPNPVWMLEGLKVVSSTFIDRKHKHLRVKVVDQTGVSTEVLWWNAHTPPENEVDLAFQVVRSGDGFHLEWVDARPTEEFTTFARSSRVVHDARAGGGRDAPASEAFAYTASVALGTHPIDKNASVVRVQFIPPTAHAWRELLQIQSITTFILVGDESVTTHPATLLKSLMQWLAQALRDHASVYVMSEEVALSVRADLTTLQKAWECLKTAGLIEIEYTDQRGWMIRKGQSSNGKPSTVSLQALNAHLQEIQAWLHYWKTTPIDALMRVGD